MNEWVNTSICGVVLHLLSFATSAIYSPFWFSVVLRLWGAETGTVKREWSAVQRKDLVKNIGKFFKKINLWKR